MSNEMTAAEMSVLGAAMIDAECCAAIVAELDAAHFSTIRHRTIYNAIRALHDRGEAVDLVTVSNEIGDDKIMTAGGYNYLGELMAYVPTTANTGSYIGILREERTRQDFIRAMRQAVKKAEDGDEEYKSDAAAAINASMATSREGIMYTTMDNVAEAMFELGESFDGVATGFPELDKWCRGGLRKGQLCILAARTSIGKTALALNIATYAARMGQRTLVFSLEMGWKSLMQRMVAERANTSLYAVTQRNDKGIDALNRAQPLVADEKIGIVDRSGLTVSQMRGYCYKARQKGLDLVIVDYLGLVQATDRKNGTREQEVSEITRTLKVMAKELQVPVLLLSQLNRDIEKRGKDSLPTLADLRESGAIEQDADIVLMLSRKKDENMGLLIIAKNRSGQTGKMDVVWNGELFTYRSLMKGYA